MFHAALLVLGAITLVGVAAAFAQILIGGRRIRRLVDVPGTPTGPKVSIVVAARDEGPHVERALQSMLAQRYDPFEIIAIDDRSADDTGTILDRLASRESRLRVVHVTDLPSGWLGKNHALQVGAAMATGEYLLFTDADVVFAPDAIARGIAYARAQNLDHLTLGPELESPSLWLALVVNFFALGFLLYFRPWHAPDPERAEHMGIGAFNLVRTSLYRDFGGHSRIALRPDDDVKLGHLVKLALGRQEVAGGLGVVRVQWYATLGQLVRGLRKNTFAGLHYSLPIASGAILVQLVVNLFPFVALFTTGGVVWFLNASVALLLMLMYAGVAYVTGSKPWLAIGFPIAAMIFVYIIASATCITLSRGGIEWRGTFYSLDELKRNTV